MELESISPDTQSELVERKDSDILGGKFFSLGQSRYQRERKNLLPFCPDF